ncbi:flagellar hook-length control protein FliK [Denitratisoma sp. agr-D3]
MPEIAATPSPVIASSNTANAAPANADTSALAGTSDSANAPADPFASMLQRLIKGKSGQSQSDQDGLDSAKLALLLENGAQTQDPALAETTGQDAMVSLMASLQAQTLGLQGQKDPTLAASQGSDSQGDKKKDDTQADSGSGDPLAALTNLLASANVPVQTDVNAKNGNGGGGNAGENGNSALNLAAKPAILAQDASTDSTAVTRKGDEESDFQTLLESARNLQTAAQERPAAAHNVPTAVVRTEAKVETPVGHPQWGQEVGDKVAWMVGKQESRAELVLNPPQMGRIEVSISMNGDQASASFNSNNPAVREALESALPRLREVLADAGVRLDQAQVGSDTRGDSPQQQERRDNSGRNDTNFVASGEIVPGLASTAPRTSTWVSQGNGMVDTFA